MDKDISLGPDEVVLLMPVVSVMGVELLMYVVKLELLVVSSGTAVLVKFDEDGGRVTVAVAVRLVMLIAVM